MPAPSTKNGRRSEKNVSKPLRFTTAGSASTWPKSGLTVAVSVTPGRSAYFRSAPTVRLLIARRHERIAGLGRLRVHLPDDIRHELQPLRRLAQLQAREIAEVRHEAVRALRDERPGVGLVEPADLADRRRSRTWRCRKDGSAAARTGSGTPRASRPCRARRRRPTRRPSRCRRCRRSTRRGPLSRPAGLTPNSNAVRRSWNESTMTFSQSDEDRCRAGCAGRRCDPARDRARGPRRRGSRRRRPP